jgi:hypothetical protein
MTEAQKPQEARSAVIAPDPNRPIRLDHFIFRSGPHALHGTIVLDTRTGAVRERWVVMRMAPLLGDPAATDMESRKCAEERFARITGVAPVLDPPERSWHKS